MLRAIILDFDGVVCDTEPLHCRAFAEVLAPRGIRLSAEEYFRRYAGLNDHAVLEGVCRHQGTDLAAVEAATLLAGKDQAYFALIADGLPLLPGAADFIRRASRRWPLAICSGAHRVEIETILRHARLLDRFPIIVSADDVAQTKPDPAGYRLAFDLLARRLTALAPSQCVAVEDSAYGLLAAKAAGLRTVAVRSRSATDHAIVADLVIPGLLALTDQVIAELGG